MNTDKAKEHIEHAMRCIRRDIFYPGEAQTITAYLSQALRELQPEPKGDKDPIVQVSGFGVANTVNTQTDYMLVGLTLSGRVVMSRGDGNWADVSPDCGGGEGKA